MRRHLSGENLSRNHHPNNERANGEHDRAANITRKGAISFALQHPKGLKRERAKGRKAAEQAHPEEQAHVLRMAGRAREFNREPPRQYPH